MAGFGFYISIGEDDSSTVELPLELATIDLMEIAKAIFKPKMVELRKELQYSEESSYGKVPKLV